MFSADGIFVLSVGISVAIYIPIVFICFISFDAIATGRTVSARAVSETQLANLYKVRCLIKNHN